MKNLYRILIISLSVTNLYAAWHVCDAYEVTVVNSVLSHKTLVNIATSTQDYTNGGITFTYPTGTFTAAPIVQVTIQLKNFAYSSATSFSVMITANSSTSTTIRVNKGTLLSLIEAATNDVTIHITATGVGV